ncbi:aspartate/glutamate racemase family protein [Neotabrizicola sp. sgz301269]|uniref:aspartate/glutamate racemase family protein n=1 Tax=Neotabrizicola sp. sgz301269 TaxID=3276282 RepID=UPI00376F7C53
MTGTGLHLGLIGGIGAAATVVYYQRLCAEMARRGLPLDLTIVQADIQSLIVHANCDGRDAQARLFAPLIDRLGAAGADCAVLTSIGAHFCFAETRALSSLPMVSAITPLDTHLARLGLGCVGILGTWVAMRTRLFGQMSRTTVIAPDADFQQVGQSYQDMAVVGTCPPDARALMFDAGRRMMERGAQAIVLAGTDLNLAFDGHDPGFPVIDALDVHVALLADLASGKVDLATAAA